MIPLLAGREFTGSDTAEAPKVAIVSERIVREYFPGGPGEALGRRVRVSDDGEWLTVVGLVADFREMGLDRSDPSVIGHGPIPGRLTSIPYESPIRRH